jgi:hypothetical protein
VWHVMKHCLVVVQRIVVVVRKQPTERRIPSTNDNHLLLDYNNKGAEVVTHSTPLTGTARPPSFTTTSSGTTTVINVANANAGQAKRIAYGATVIDLFLDNDDDDEEDVLPFESQELQTDKAAFDGSPQHLTRTIHSVMKKME